MKYLIEATLVKNSGAPVHWQRYSDKMLSKQDCLKMLSKCD
ncbi:Double-strand break reduction protein [Arsenophonus endosymbiont of Aleurodicus floccissimus]|nr:Double-strand break reduction protein [Arsenophonus endosymbiont of Aleurodicus floccissimus]